MKKRTKLMIALAVACAGTLVLGACSTEYYEKIYKNGNDVRITFDPNDGVFANQTNVQVVYYYKHTDVEKGIEMYAPDDSLNLGSSQAQTISRSGYFLAGWYTERTPRTNSAGEPVDDEGNVCRETPVLDEEGNPTKDASGNPVTQLLSDSGKKQGYIYSNRWDFESKQKITMDDLEKDGKFYELKLYAAWVPNYSYQIMTKKGDGSWEVGTSTSFNPIDSESMREISIPAWNEETGAMDYGKFPSINGKTFKAVYSDPEMKNEVTKIEHNGSVDISKGISVDGVKIYYAEYDDGVWFKVKTAAQFANNMQIDACYEILADLDFTDQEWPISTVRGNYSGQIKGNNHKIMNVTVEYNGSSDSSAGLFGNLLEGARFENISFENINFSLMRGSRSRGAQFGLFAGTVNAAVQFENVKISGTLYVGTTSELSTEGFIPQFTGEGEERRENYFIGILTGNNNDATKKLEDSIENIKVEGVGKVKVTVNKDTGRVTTEIVE